MKELLQKFRRLFVFIWRRIFPEKTASGHRVRPVYIFGELHRIYYRKLGESWQASTGCRILSPDRTYKILAGAYVYGDTARSAIRILVDLVEEALQKGETKSKCDGVDEYWVGVIPAYSEGDR